MNRSCPWGDRSPDIRLNPPHTCTRWCVDHGDSDCYSASVADPRVDQCLSVGFTPAVNSPTDRDECDLIVETPPGEPRVQWVKLTPTQAAAIAEVFNAAGSEGRA